MRRLTSSSRAGITRKLVAVGTPRLAVMLATTRAAAPRSGVASTASFAAAGPGGADPVAGAGGRGGHRRLGGGRAGPGRLPLQRGLRVGPGRLMGRGHLGSRGTGQVGAAGPEVFEELPPTLAHR